MLELTAEKIWEETYTLVPSGVRKWHLVAEGLQRLSLLVVGGFGHNHGGSGFGRAGGGSGRRLDLLGVEGADLELGLVLLENTLVVVLPELLAGILSGYARKDLLAACEPVTSVSIPAFFRGPRVRAGHTWVVLLEGCQVIDILIDNDVQVGGLVMRLDVAQGESFRHGERGMGLDAREGCDGRRSWIYVDDSRRTRSEQEQETRSLGACWRLFK